MALKKGLLLLNLGTPDGPEPEDVGRYLKEFLMDARVVDIPTPLRWILVNLLIVPKRKYLSSLNYKKIWTKRGSPLLFHLEDLAASVGAALEGRFQTLFAMRYGRPNIESALQSFKDQGLKKVVIFPLYPQFADSTTGSSIAECLRVAADIGLEAQIKFVEPFYNHPEFINACNEIAQPILGSTKSEHVLFSFHGVPERHVRRADKSGQCCLNSKEGSCYAACCDKLTLDNQNCYRAQCVATAHLLASRFGLVHQEQWSISFQSRLGRTPWIGPYTDDVVCSLAKAGVKRLAVVMPSFTADCLETLEEIAHGGSETFQQAGGTEFNVIPCLNSHPRWVQAVTQILSAY
jgi:ferrochelatase